MFIILVELVQQRSQLAEEILDYLRNLIRQCSVLPAYYPTHLQTDDHTHFDDIWQTVQVVEGRSRFEASRTEEQERQQAAGYSNGR